jgi:hypothetical protein
MIFLKYLVGGVLVVILRGIYDVFNGGKFELTQSNMTAYAVTVILGMLAFAATDQLFKGRY